MEKIEAEAAAFVVEERVGAVAAAADLSRRLKWKKAPRSVPRLQSQTFQTTTPTVKTIGTSRAMTGGSPTLLGTLHRLLLLKQSALPPSRVRSRVRKLLMEVPSAERGAQVGKEADSNALSEPADEEADRRTLATVFVSRTYRVLPSHTIQRQPHGPNSRSADADEEHIVATIAVTAA